jgi:hypothetical protein
MNSVTWKTLVLDAIQGLPRHFTLADLSAKREWFARHYPANRFVDAKIRQTLQILRDQGAISFIGGGQYSKTETQPAFSPLIHPDLGHGYKSSSQVARVVLETWAEMNLYCLSCDCDSLTRHPPNQKSADFFCAGCRSEYQVKSKNGRFGDAVAGAHYATTIAAIERSELPDYVLVEYDLRRRSVVFVDGIPGQRITVDRIRPRKPLSADAKRAGWQGCTIDLSDLARTPIVRPAAIARQGVRSTWHGNLTARPVVSL